MATFWIDPTGGDDANDGTTKALAVQTFSDLIGLLSNDDSVKIVDGTHDISAQSGLHAFTQTGLTFDSENSDATLCTFDAGGVAIWFTFGLNYSWSNTTFYDFLSNTNNTGILNVGTSDSTVTLNSLIFRETYCPGAYQGCIGITSASNVTLNVLNCIFDDNYSDAWPNYTSGCVIFRDQTGATININNCSYYASGTPLNIRGGYINTSSDVIIKNLILHSVGSVDFCGADHMGTGTHTISYSCLYSSGGSVGTNYFTVGDGMLAVDPLYVDPAASNFQLQASSPCIDTGTVV